MLLTAADDKYACADYGDALQAVVLGEQFPEWQVAGAHIIVVDENEVGAYLYQEGDLAIVRPRAAVAVIEVKTHLDGQRFGQAFTNIASVRRLESKIQGFVFGYESSKLTDKVRMITSRSATAVSSGSRSTGQHWGCGPKWARAGNCRSCSH